MTPGTELPDVGADGEGVTILVNPGSGTAVVRSDPLPTVRRRLPAARIVELDDGQRLDDAVADA